MRRSWVRYEVASRLAAEAARRGVPVQQLVVELRGAQVPPAAETLHGKRFAFIGMGDSGEGGGDVAGRHDEIRREAFAQLASGQV